MRYVGGKARVGRELVKAILDDGAPTDRWFEPFVGGGNILVHAASVFGKCLAMDAHPDLIMMWQKAVNEHWTPPHTITKERYEQLRREESSALRGFAGFGCSYGGKWFGGYVGVGAKTPYGGAAEAASVIAKQASLFAMHGVVFQHGQFGCRPPAPGTVLYCDPPYAGTTGYDVALDHAFFYAKCAEYAASGAYVYVSEYSIPAYVSARLIWQRDIQSPLNDNTNSATERLFRIEE